MIEEGNALLLPEARSFWREHSDRAGLDSRAASLRVDEPERAFLGRGAKGSANVCVRTASRVCENIQRVVSQYARESLDDGPDYFGEDGLFKDLAAHLRTKGVEEASVAWQLARLKVSDYTRDPTPGRGLTQAVRHLGGPDLLKADEDGDTDPGDCDYDEGHEEEDEAQDEQDEAALPAPAGAPSSLASPEHDAAPAAEGGWHLAEGDDREGEDALAQSDLELLQGGRADSGMATP